MLESIKFSKREFCQIVYLKNYKTVFFAIPKVANSSLKSFFAETLELEGDGDRKGGKAYLFNHESSSRYLKREKILIDIIMAESLNDCYKYGFVRNPFDRLYSFYKTVLSSEHVCNSLIKVYGNKFNQKMSFSQFVEQVAKIPDVISNRHFMSQYLFLTNSDGKLLVNDVGYFERIEEDLQKLCKKVEIPFTGLKNVNRSGVNGHYSNVYSDEMLAKIKVRYKKDFEMFNFI